MAEYFNRAAALAHSAAEISKRVSEGLVENAKDFGFENPVQFYDNAELKLADVKKKLDSRVDRDKLEGMRRLIAVITKGHDAAEFFPDVVKNVASGNLEIRQLVYMYLLRYAEQEPDLALLSINTFQKDLGDRHQGIRAMALRVLSSIRVPIISSIVLMAIQKGVADRSPYVRKIAAFAIPKLHSLDPSLTSSLVTLIQNLLHEKTPITIGSVIQAFNGVCPDRFDLIHPHFAKLCLMLIDTDEWGQIAIVNLLLRYARTQFINPNPVKPRSTTPGSSNGPSPSFSKDYESIPDSQEPPPGSGSDIDDNHPAKLQYLDEDHALLLRSFWPLLQSDNAAVVMTVVSALYHIGPYSDLPKVVKPLIRVLRASRELEYAVLTHIRVICEKQPDLFTPHMHHFFVTAEDPAYIWQLKIQILQATLTEQGAPALLRELQRYLRSDQPALVEAAIETVGRCAQRLSARHHTACLRGLVVLTRNSDPIIVGHAVAQLRALIRTRTVTSEAVPSLLAALVSVIVQPHTAPLARENVYYLVGEFAAAFPQYPADLLQWGARSFKTETSPVKLSILTLAAKASVALPLTPTLQGLVQYLFTLARFDLDYDLRDRARFLQQLIQPYNEPDTTDYTRDDPSPSSPSSASSPRTLAKSLATAFLGGKPAPVTGPASATQPRPITDRDSPLFDLNSLSLLLNHPVAGYQDLPAWPPSKPPAVFRGQAPATSDRADRSSRGNNGAGGGGGGGGAPRNTTSTSKRKASKFTTAARAQNLNDLDAFYSQASSPEERLPATVASVSPLPYPKSSPHTAYRPRSAASVGSHSESTDGYTTESSWETDSQSHSDYDSTSSELSQDTESEEELGTERRNLLRSK
ncbi:AP-3 complex subunit beta [Dimargaris cristalligena]|nr:AP-3 complex subunit beta [Dimargaris cristalligena]